MGQIMTCSGIIWISGKCVPALKKY